MARPGDFRSPAVWPVPIPAIHPMGSVGASVQGLRP